MLCDAIAMLLPRCLYFYGMFKYNGRCVNITLIRENWRCNFVKTKQQNSKILKNKECTLAVFLLLHLWNFSRFTRVLHNGLRQNIQWCSVFSHVLLPTITCVIHVCSINTSGRVKTSFFLCSSSILWTYFFPCTEQEAKSTCSEYVNE